MTAAERKALERELRSQWNGLSSSARRAIYRAAKGRAHVDAALIAATLSRETNMKNIVGDGGHGRGIGQQDDRWLPDFLASVRGCRSGSSVPIFRSALPKGRVPTISAGVNKVASVLEGNIVEAKRQNVPAGHRTHVGVAGYNEGIGGAIHAYKTHGNPDVGTTGRDYGADVLERARILRTFM